MSIHPKLHYWRQWSQVLHVPSTSSSIMSLMAPEILFWVSEILLLLSLFDQQSFHLSGLGFPTYRKERVGLDKLISKATSSWQLPTRRRAS